MENFEISTTLKKSPKFKKKTWDKMRQKVLGKNYELSLVFIGDKKSKKLNTDFRGKKKIANVLSFPIDKNFGEIFINFPNAKKECKKFERNTENFIDFLFIHGLAHLKGHDHIKEDEAKKMENFEKKIRKEFSV